VNIQDTGNSDDNEKRWDEKRRRELIDRYGKRSDESANFLRVALFALATVTAGFLIKESYSQPLNMHSISIGLFAVAIVLIVVSWEYQKGKSLARVDALQSANWLQEFQRVQASISERVRNQTIDRSIEALIAGGFLSELIIMLPTLCRW
jgi:hypothetical protein